MSDGAWKKSKGRSLKGGLPEGDGEGKHVVNVDPDYPKEFELSSAECLPRQAKILYGCLNCEWRNSGVCPFEYKAGRATKSNTHTDLICRERGNWLMSLGGVSSGKQPSWSKWQADFNRSMGQVVLNSDYFMIQKLEGELQDLIKEESGIVAQADGIVILKEREEFMKPFQAKINILEERKRALRQEFFLLWRELAKVDESRLNREAPKRIDLNVRTRVNLSDIHSIMRGEDIIEAETTPILKTETPPATNEPVEKQKTITTADPRA